ncbi:hypothetical protein GALL_477130 [mine drainage metagenome]|uniref:Uncharacterized protein n=1 Tax=mine drainage metagenome TaxID=410659 RepID=A0A1J5PGC2_9ZZZZ
MLGHRDPRGLFHLARILVAHGGPALKAPALGQVAVDRVVCRCLVGEQVRSHAAGEQLGQQLGGVAQQADRHRLLRLAGATDDLQGLVERPRLTVQITSAQPHLDPRLLALDSQAGGPGHHRRERLGSAHAAKSRGQQPLAGEISGMVLAAHLHEGLIGALHDPLGADIDPGAGGHLAVHGQTRAIELVEVVPGRPARHQVRIGDQHAGRVGMGAEHPDRLAGLHQQGLVVLQTPQGLDDLVVALPVAGGAADAAIDHQLLGPFGHVGVQVVHQHAQRRLGQPALRREGRAGRGTDDAGGIETGHGVLRLGRR